MSPIKYVHEAVRNCETHLVAKLPNRAHNLFKVDYDPELDFTPELESDAASYLKLPSVFSDL